MYTENFKKSSSPEPLGQIQSTLVQIILGQREFKFVHIKGRVLFKGEIIANYKNVQMGGVI
jgi:Fe-S cluster assembly ATPase SufC